MPKWLWVVPLSLSLSLSPAFATSLTPPPRGLSVGIHPVPSYLPMIPRCAPSGLCAVPRSAQAGQQLSDGFAALPWVSLPDFESMQDVWLSRDVARLPTAG